MGLTHFSSCDTEIVQLIVLCKALHKKGFVCIWGLTLCFYVYGKFSEAYLINWVAKKNPEINGLNRAGSGFLFTWCSSRCREGCPGNLAWVDVEGKCVGPKPTFNLKTRNLLLFRLGWGAWDTGLLQDHLCVFRHQRELAGELSSQDFCLQFFLDLDKI